jgi:SWI/SNF-related matrix-associated actin-dependent regulator 1 of chromatin subfamily A
MIVNRYPGKCQSCSDKVAVGEGFAYKNGFKWLTVCKSTACMRRLGLNPPNGGNGKPRREITADGKVIMPFDREAIPLLRAMPGARWSPEDKVWTVSVKPGDLRRVVEVADQLCLDVPDPLRKQATEGTPEMREAKKRASHKGLYPFQRDGVEFLALHEKALLADDMGLGKTIQTLVALPDNPRVICITPAAVKYNWQDEAEKWRPDLKVTVLSGRNSFKLPEPGEMVIVNYDILPKWLTPAPKTKEAPVTQDQKVILKQTILVADEAHLVKNYKAQRSKKVSTLSRLCAKTWFLTGTPLMNRPTDLYGVLSSGGMYVLGGWAKFCSLFNGWKNQWGGWEFGMPTAEVPERMKRVMIRRIRTEVLPDLPPKTYQVVSVNDLDRKLKKELDEKLTDLMIGSGFTEAEAKNMVSNFDNLLKAVESLEAGTLDPGQVEAVQEQKELIEAVSNLSMPGFEEFSEIRAKLASARIPAVEEIVESYEESDTPLVVFSAHVAPIKAIGSRQGWDCITGDTNPKDRRDIVKAFQSGQLKGVACTIQAGGVGVTLTRASTALFVDLDWTPAWNLQAEDRICRIGQTSNKVLIQHLQSNHPLDKHIQKLIRYKMQLMTQALDEDVRFKPPRNFDGSKPAPEVVEESDADLAARLAALEEAGKEAERQVARDKVSAILGREIAKSDIPEPELTPKRKELIKDALAFMVGRCDGAIEKDFMGFNRPDACIAHWIYATGLRDGDETTFRVTERILSRYYRQLNEQFGAIWTPEMRKE